MSLGKMSSILRWQRHKHNAKLLQYVDRSMSASWLRVQKNQLDLVINLRPILNRFVFLRNFYVCVSVLVCDRWLGVRGGCSIRVCPCRHPCSCSVGLSPGYKCKFYIIYFLLSIGQKWRRKFIRCVMCVYHRVKSVENI